MVRIVWPVAHKPAGFCIIAEGINAGRSVANSQPDHLNGDGCRRSGRRCTGTASRSRLLLMEKSSTSRPVAFTAACTSLTKGSAAVLGLMRTANRLAPGTSSCKSPKRFAVSSSAMLVTPVTLVAGPVEAAHEAGLDRVGAGIKNDRSSGGCGFGGECRRGAEQSYDHCHLTTNEVGRQYRQPPIVVLRPAVFDRDILALRLGHPANKFPVAGQSDGVLTSLWGSGDIPPCIGDGVSLVVGRRLLEERPRF
jgi:hypothetical protein